MAPSLERLIERYREIDALKSAVSLLSWDRQVLMPPGGNEARSAHIGRLSRMAHELLVSDETQRLLESTYCEVEPDTEEEDMLRAFRRDLSVAIKLPADLVEEKSKVSSEAYEAWRQAKRDSNFALLRPYLERLFEIAHESAELIGYEDHVYDPLIDLFEEGATFAQARLMFDDLKPEIMLLVSRIQEEGQVVDDGFLYGSWPADKLRSFAECAADAIGFDFSHGRLDLCTNAFCTHMATDDVRMTTRHSESITGVIFSSLHEMGHGLYEQKSVPEWDRTPLAGGVSLGIHESQSRLWENIVGRSRPFWQHFLSQLYAMVPEIPKRSLDEFYAAINKVKPSLIRIGSDELTYNLHIMIRFELECEILTGEVAVRDLPEAWNAKMEEYLGLTPPDDARGVLQDVHWSRGSVGYFPTYTMGNLIGWQIWEKLTEEILDYESQMAAGQFGDVLSWLTSKVYREGRRQTPKELVDKVTGRPMGVDAFVSGMTRKFAGIYGFEVD